MCIIETEPRTLFDYIWSTYAVRISTYFAFINIVGCINKGQLFSIEIKDSQLNEWISRNSMSDADRAQILNMEI